MDTHGFASIVEKHLELMLNPSSDLEKIVKRQNISKFMVEQVTSDNNYISNLMYMLLKEHDKAIDTDKSDITEIAHNFSTVVHCLSKLEEELTGCQEMDLFLEPIRGHLNRFGEEPTIVDEADRKSVV